MRVNRWGPGPDEEVWVYNTVFLREEDGTWHAWLEPLDTPRDRPERTLSARGPTAPEARRLLTVKVLEQLNSLEPEPKDDFQRKHAVCLLRRDIPDEPFPIEEGYYRNLGFLLGGER